MSPEAPGAEDARMLARAKAWARAARVSRIRRRLAFGAAAVFVACWAAVFDAYSRSLPSAGDGVASASPAATAPEVSSASTAPEEELDDDGTFFSPVPDTSTEPATAPVPLTTSQS